MTEAATEAEGGPVVAAPEARRLAAAWTRDVEAHAARMLEFLAAHLAELREDRVTAEITLAACEANLQALLSMMRHGIPAKRAEAPSAALEHARHMAARGASVDVTLRFYRLGHAWFTELWNAALVEKVRDPPRLLSAVRESVAVSFAYIDVVSAKVSAELIAERDRRQRRATAVRADAVDRLLAGESVDADRLESTLAFALKRPLFAFLCWTDGDAAALEHAAAALAAKAGSGRPLILAEGTGELVGWAHLDGAREPSTAALAKATAAAAPEVHVAIGGIGSGVEAFRQSRNEAERARRLAQLTGRPAPSFTRYADVALVDLLSRDLVAAQALVAAELGALAERGERTAVLRATLLAYLSARGSPAATAAALRVHRNTALQRLHRAEALRGQPIGVRSHELLAALLLADMLGDVVLAAG